MEENKDEFVRWNENQTETPNLHEVRCNAGPIDLVAELKKKDDNFFCGGKYVFYKNTIKLPSLGGNQYYKSFSELEVVRNTGENGGSARWNWGNLHEGKATTTSSDGKNASVTFSTGSSDMTIRWKGEVYEKSSTTSEKPIKETIDDPFFTVFVPVNAKPGASMIVEVKGHKFLVSLGKSDKSNKIQLIDSTNNGVNVIYNYKIVE